MTKLREFILPSGTKVVAGKSAETNEELIKQVEKDELVFHTKAKGSPFVNIKGKPKFFSTDVKNAAIICARYSQDWRDNKKDVLVHKFKGNDISKTRIMKTGTFGVKNAKNIKVRKEDILRWEKLGKFN